MNDQLRPSTEADDELRARHRQHVHRDGCHRWFDHEKDQLTDLAGPAGWCDGCTEDWPCDTTRALNRAALGSGEGENDG